MSGNGSPVPPSPQPPRRSRRDRVRENDERIRQALIQELVAVGWDDIALTGIAKRAGLSVGALYARAETRSELGNLVWASAVRDWLREALTNVVTTAQTGDSEALAAAFAKLESAGDMPAAAVEFLIASHFDDELDEVVGSDARQLVNELRVLRPGGAEGPAPPHTQAANVLLLAFALGRLMAQRSVPELPPLAPGQAQAHTVTPQRVAQERSSLPAIQSISFDKLPTLILNSTQWWTLSWRLLGVWGIGARLSPAWDGQWFVVESIQRQGTPGVLLRFDAVVHTP